MGLDDVEMAGGGRTSPNDTSLKTSLLLTPTLYDTSLIDTSPNDLP